MALKKRKPYVLELEIGTLTIQPYNVVKLQTEISSLLKTGGNDQIDPKKALEAFDIMLDIIVENGDSEMTKEELQKYLSNEDLFIIREHFLPTKTKTK